jgi:NAD(P)-dependent dehydrogenase (short-subunit alcohol dehydrogenase family)
MSNRLKGKNAVVTGGTGGIGAPVCMALAAEGANVVVNDVGAARDGSGTNTALVDNVVAEIKKRRGTAIANYEPVADFAAAERLIKACLDSFGRIDILVNLHGNLRDRMIWNMTEDEWDSVINVHLKGTFNTCRHACVRMREQRYGRIINVTSDAWRRSTGHVNYAAAKGGVVSLTRSIAMEVGKYGVTANCFAPIAATRMTLTEEVKAGMRKRVEQGIMTQEQFDEMMGNMPGPEHIPPIVVYLASDKAANINGRVFHIERGRVAIYSEPIEEKAIYKTEAGGMWTVDELEQAIPNTLLVGYINEAPPQEASK